MENGYDEKLGEKFSGMKLGLEDSSLFQVMKAVEAAEATIKQQVEENNRLRSQLQNKILLLQKYKLEEEEESSSSERVNLNLNEANIARLSQQLRIDPTRFQKDGDLEQRLNLPEQGLMPLHQSNPDNLWKQDLDFKMREHEEEIMQLRKHLADYSIKEAQIRNEKHVLEKRIAYMRLAFDQQQQDLVDAASKALSYRQDIIEENIRLTYALQDAQQERSTFVSSLLPLLAEYSLQPPVLDAQSIVSNVKVLFKHLQEKLFLTETKLKESQYQLTPWRSDVNHSNVAPPSPSHSTVAAMTTLNTNGLELVPQPTYSHGKIPVPTSGAQSAAEWDPLIREHSGGVGGVPKPVEADDLGRFSPLTRRTSVPETSTQVTLGRPETHVAEYDEGITSKQVTFRDPVSNNEIEDHNAEGNQNKRDTTANVSAGNPYTATLDDPSSSYSPYLAPVLEEPSSSFSEAADDDPLPAIDSLQISGEAFPGHELQASGYSINGTTSCNFEWVRYREDGSVNYIDGAKQPNYLVTADDIDTYLAIEVQPLDNRKRKGELVKVFANENKKITCDPEMQDHIKKALQSGHASYKVLLWTGYLDIYEQATLAVKREAYSIKCIASSGGLVTEKFSPSTTVTIPYGSSAEFIITGSGGSEHFLKADSDPDISNPRDTIVLTLRYFITRAGERRKSKKRSLFFNK